MADYTAFVEADNALLEMLRDSLTPEPLSDRELISLRSPHDSGNSQLTLYLYQIEEEAPENNVGYYQADRTTQRLRPVSYVLRYLLTAHSKAPEQLKEADQHRILGAALRALRDNSVIPAKYLTGSSADEGAELHVSVEKMSMDEILKLWNNNTKEYKLSVVVMLTGVSVDSGLTRRVSRVTEVEINPQRSESDAARPGTGGAL